MVERGKRRDLHPKSKPAASSLALKAGRSLRSAGSRQYRSEVMLPSSWSTSAAGSSRDRSSGVEPIMADLALVTWRPLTEGRRIVIRCEGVVQSSGGTRASWQPRVGMHWVLSSMLTTGKSTS